MRHGFDLILELWQYKAVGRRPEYNELKLSGFRGAAPFVAGQEQWLACDEPVGVEPEQEVLGVYFPVAVLEMHFVREP
jgi:hypothetical protein